MSIFKKIKSFFSGWNYKINRNILSDYMNEQIAFSIENQLSFCDEFYLKTNKDDTNKLHVSIVNYDVECEAELESEEYLSGIIIFVNNKKAYNPETDEKYYSVDDFIRFRLVSFPDEFILVNEIGSPISLELYKMEN